MKKRNRFLALLLAATLSFSVSACGSEADDNAQTPSGGQESSVSDSEGQDDVDALAAAQEKMQDISSMDAKMVLEMDMEAGAEGQSQTMESVTKVDMTCFYDPIKIKMDIEVDAGENGTTATTSYVEQGKDGSLTMYADSGSEWIAQTVSMDDIAQYDAADNMKMYLDEDYNFEKAGTEQVEGADAYKYTGSITGEDMKEAILGSGALDSLSSLGFDASAMDGMMDDVDGMPITLWIDAESLYPVKYEMDMTSVMDSLMASLLKAMGDQAEGVTMSIPKMKLEMTCSNYNEAEDFKIPKEAKKANKAAES